MPDLKLAKLPDHTPTRLTITVTPELIQMPATYADGYRAAYGQAETVADIVPYMLRSFLDGDREFTRSRGRDERKKR